MSSWSSGLQPWLRPYAEALVRIAPPGTLTITSTFRSITDQQRLWNNRHNNPYPVAPPGRSYHNYGRAWDMTGDERWLRYLGSVWNQWGGTWSDHDVIHFQA